MYTAVPALGGHNLADGHVEIATTITTGGAVVSVSKPGN